MPVLTKIATGAAVAAGGAFNGSWSNEQNARVATNDETAAGSNTYATAAPGKNQEYASLWPFVFSDIPNGSTINSTSVKVQWKVSTTSSVATLRSTAFADNGAGAPDQTTAVSASPGVDRTSEPTTDTDDTYSATPTLAQLQQGIWIRAQILRGNSNTAVTGSLDYIQVTVDYTEGAQSFTLTADGGSYTETGTASNLERHAKVAGASGTYAHTGTAASLERHSKLTADTVAYTFSGTDASFRVGITLSADGGTYSHTGTAATFLRALILGASNGSYTWSGSTASLKPGYLILGSASSYLWVGADATLTYDGGASPFVRGPAAKVLYVLPANCHSNNIIRTTTGVIYLMPGEDLSTGSVRTSVGIVTFAGHTENIN